MRSDWQGALDRFSAMSVARTSCAAMVLAILSTPLWGLRIGLPLCGLALALSSFAAIRARLVADLVVRRRAYQWNIRSRVVVYER